jgi:hypothetical protein
VYVRVDEGDRGRERRRPGRGQEEAERRRERAGAPRRRPHQRHPRYVRRPFFLIVKAIALQELGCLVQSAN